jgi:hypothetical protein
MASRTSENGNGKKPNGLFSEFMGDYLAAI